MGPAMTFRALGALFLILATIFIFQIIGVAMEIGALPETTITSLPEGGISLDLRRWSVHHFYFTREGFLLLHPWLIWAFIRLAKSRQAPVAADRILLGATVLVLAAGHFIGTWLAAQGASVAVW